MTVENPPMKLGEEKPLAEKLQILGHRNSIKVRAEPERRIARMPQTPAAGGN